jgi:hypothetical protein
MTRTLPKLGNTVIDTLTGVKGIAYQYIEMISGTVQLAVQPKLPADTAGLPGAEPVLPGINIDIQLLDVVDEGIADRVIQPGPETIALGNEVETMIGGQTGVAINRLTFINGCVYYHVQQRPTQKQKDEGTLPEMLFVSSKMLKVTGQGLAKQAETNMTEPVQKRPGGPSTRATRAGAPVARV